MSQRGWLGFPFCSLGGGTRPQRRTVKARNGIGIPCMRGVAYHAHPPLGVGRQRVVPKIEDRPAVELLVELQQFGDLDNGGRPVSPVGKELARVDGDVVTFVRPCSWVVSNANMSQSLVIRRSREKRGCEQDDFLRDVPESSDV